MKKIIISSLLIVLALSVSGLFYLYAETYWIKGNSDNDKIFSVEEGDGVREVAQNLKDQDIISCRTCFLYYLWDNNLISSILPGEYEIKKNLTIPEIAFTLGEEKNEKIKITFPEGWTSLRMAQRLKENGLDSEGFLRLVKNPAGTLTNHPLLKDARVTNLEGYLFPDTYFFTKDYTAEDIVDKVLTNFESKISPEMLLEIKNQKKTLPEVITLASIVEKEVDSENDRKIVSGLFWKRIEKDQALQSCATIAYALGKNEKQFSFEETRVNSPYNTYINKGLPVGPISNPGLSAIEAVIYPQASDFNYFLSDPKTGETIFSKTYDEQLKNKAEHNL